MVCTHRLLQLLIVSIVFTHAQVYDGAINSSSDNDPVVKVDSGRLQGYVISTPKGQCNTFLGVPFAAPPIGNLRWRKPEPPASWQGVRQAKTFGPMCIQWGSKGTNPDTESEDCLYLNIFAPKKDTENSSGGLPVMVFIHGGYFAFGTPSDMGTDNICGHLVSRGVIIVELQYRLFLYGFYSTGDEAAPGNYAVWDQIEALKWVKRNIASFGGDPNKVTIFGHSAGGVAVSYLTYTPVATDLFQASVGQSGSIFMDWAKLRDVSVPTSRMLAEAANCTAPDTHTYTSCLRNLTTADLQQAHNTMDATFISPIPHLHHILWQWAARADGELFMQEKPQDLKTGRPAVIGVVPWEISAPTNDCIAIADQFLNSTLDTLINGSDQRTNGVLKSIARYVYIDSKGDPNDPIFVCNQAFKTRVHYGMEGFIAGAAEEATSKASSGNPTYVYNFNYVGDYLFPPDYKFEKAAVHSQELCYLFQLADSPYMPCPQTYEGVYRTVADNTAEIWTNFAKTGYPSPTGLQWPQFHNISHANTMTIQANLSIENTFFIDATSFWNYLKPEIESRLRQ